MPCVLDYLQYSTLLCTVSFFFVAQWPFWKCRSFRLLHWFFRFSMKSDDLAFILAAVIYRINSWGRRTILLKRSDKDKIPIGSELSLITTSRCTFLKFEGNFKKMISPRPWRACGRLFQLFRRFCTWWHPRAVTRESEVHPWLSHQDCDMNESLPNS